MDDDAYDGVDTDGVRDGEVRLFMLIPIAGLDCCCEYEFELPIPGLLGVSAGKDEFNALRVLSGVMVLLVP
jgi:hypothetical protein